MLGRFLVLCGAATLALATASLGHAQPPPPLSSELFAFPGTVKNPSSGASAGLALADRWLGAEPYDNPAVAPGSRLLLSPALMRVSRQDLRADNRNYDEQGASFDLGGAALGAPPLRGIGLWAYAAQPVVRLEENAFTRGTGVSPNPGSPPGVIQSLSEVRETRAGLAASFPVAGFRVGAALEWTRREDLYRASEQSGSPQSGTQEVSFEGEAFGGQIGARFERGQGGAGALVVAAAARFEPELKVSGEHTYQLLVGAGEDPVDATLQSGWEGGATVRYQVGEGFAALASLGGQTSRRWDGFGVESGPGMEWSVGGEVHDARDPWALRFGLGQEQQSGVPEPHATRVGLGFGWSFGGVALDIGALRRSVQRSDSPTSYDDRVVASLRVDF